MFTDSSNNVGISDQSGILYTCMGIGKGGGQGGAFASPVFQPPIYLKYYLNGAILVTVK